MKKVLNYRKKIVTEQQWKDFFLKICECLLTYMICVNIIEHGLFNTIETMLVVGMCFLLQWQKGNVIKVALEHPSLRMVPTIVIAHMFCASPDTRISYRQCCVMQGYFCAVLNYPEKVGLSKYSWYPKRKLGVTMHFWEIIKLQFEKERHTFLF